MLDTMTKPKFDILYTPEMAVKPLLKYLNKGSKVWECSDPGTSLISKVLKEVGHEVISSDITTGFDFLKDLPNWDFDVIVSNPPFSLKDKWLQRCYDYKKPFALLLPITTLEGIERSLMFKKYGISVIVLDKRIDFTGKNSPWFNVSWFTKGILPDNTLWFEAL